MKHCLAKLVVFLLLGAVVNVAVAWGCALWVDSSEGEQVIGYTVTSGVVWRVTVVRRSGAVRVDSFRWRQSAYAQGLPYKGPSVSDVAPYWGGLATPTAAFLTQTGRDWRQVEGRGWPVISLWYMGDKTEEPDLAVWKWAVPGASPAEPHTVPEERPWFHPLRLLPLRPASRGFAINTIFYAAILWMLTLGTVTLRRVIRRKRGHCIKCGYDLSHAEHEVCPECGLGREVVEAIRRN